MTAPDHDRSLRDEASLSLWTPLVDRLPNPEPPKDGLNAPSGAADEFFESFPIADEDAWRFLDDDLVGVGPSILKLMRRRSPPRR
jgi:hypothetical protein